MNGAPSSPSSGQSRDGQTSGGFEPPRKAWVTALISLAIVGLGVGGALVLVRTKPKPGRETAARLAPSVEVISAHFASHPVIVRAHGEVTAARTLIVMSEVGGRIVWQNESLVPGGFIKAGEQLVRIDPRDYAIGVKQQEALVSSQSLQLELERGRHEVAKREWELYQAERSATASAAPMAMAAGVPALLPPALTSAQPSLQPSAEPPALALRVPHFDSAKVALRAAAGGLEKAQLSLSRTTLSAPFNAVVDTESVEVGQLALPQAPLATLVGTDMVWVRVALPLSELSYLRFPSPGVAGASARVFAETGKGRIFRNGTVSRLLGALEPTGRLARILIDVEDPFGRRAKELGLPLLLGSFVHVEIDGGQLDQVIELPRRALEPGGRVYVLDQDDKLASRRVEIVLSGEDTVLVRGELAEAERVIVSPLAAPVLGMKLRVVERRAASGMVESGVPESATASATASGAAASAPAASAPAASAPAASGSR
ncbi:MAG: HlyD family efflux transporter periplasmic adaptor subunit [Myxococcales bacterium]|nr:HlyD family efflux transporter periplasmic adaptor subunit [Myxococcales bacterium]